MRFEDKDNPLNDVKVPILGQDDLAGKTIHWILNGNMDNYRKVHKGIAPKENGF